jgi:predicted nucleic acid-binding protein
VRENSVVITDTSCFVLLEKINALPILHSLFSTVTTTPEIAKEYGNILPPWVIIQAVNNKALQHEFNQYIDPGEASAIALASEINCKHLIIDDMAARKFAEKLGLPIKGTVGVLLMAKQKGVIPLLRPYLDLIQQTNFRLSQKLVDQFINDAGE